MSVNDQILDAIELLAKTSVERAGYDKTIQAQIISCQDPSIGKYKCKYQDATFYAYTGNSDIILTKGTFVYVLVPENDMSKEKTIIGTVDKLGIDYRSSAVGDQAYNVIGFNVIWGGISPYDKFYLDVDIVNYSFNIYDVNNNINLINLQVAEFNQYIKQASSIIIGMNVKTNIPSEKQKIGSYGIKFSLEFKDDNGNEGIIREYILDENRMVDNPYNLIYPTRQYAIFDIDNQNFVRINKITIFNKDFPNAQRQYSGIVDESNAQIELSNFELSCAVRMSQEELNGLGLSIISPRGLIFFDIDEPKILQAQVKFKGKVIPSDNISFYWGIEDLQITPQSEGKYNKYLGRGWRCINEKNIIQPQGGASTIQWLSYGDTYIFPFEQALAQNNRMRVAAVYDSNVITKQVNVQNLTALAASIVITSATGTQFYYGVGQTLLQCEVSNILRQGDLVFAWGRENNGGQLQQFSQTTNSLHVEARYIYNFAIYRCSVYDRYEDEDHLIRDHLIGTASIRLTNSMQGEGTNPLIIQNGTVLFKYNEKGISPTSKTLQNPQKIQVLKFKLYDDKGDEIQIFHGQGSQRLIDSRASVKWRVPAENTLLRLLEIPQNESEDQQDQSETSQDESEGQQNGSVNGYYIIKNSQSLTYDIAQRYDVRKTVNQIILQVTYDGATSFAQTNLTFTKQGQIGTNGTDYYVNVMPNTQMASPPLFPMITKFSNGNYKLNYGLDAYDDYTINPNLSLKPLLKVQFLHGGEPISSGYTVKWRVLKNRYGTQNGSPVEDESDFTINQSTGIMTYTGNLALNDTRSRANVIECEITYDGHIYYGAIPFITAYMTDEDSSFDLVDGTGFHYVMYSSQGMQPEYSSLPFEFTDGNNGTCTVLGNTKIKNGNTWSLQSSGDLVQDSQDQFKIQPIGFYKGECVNNSVRYQNSDGIINIPVHFYLNRYNFAHLNGWDGNSIQINNEDGYILAPQMGAGKKQNDNSFTGVLMGQVKNPMKNQSNIGLFGYAQGERSFFINSENGSAIFGKSGNGEIIIDPGSNKAMLYSHNFWSSYNQTTGLPNSYYESNYADAGMLIDLTTPQIVFKNKMFHIDADGSIWAGRQKINNQYTSNYNFSVDAITGDVQMIGGIKAGKKTIDNRTDYNFKVDKDTGALFVGYNGDYSLNNYYNFSIDANGNVALIGDITANSGHIGGPNGWTIGYNDDTSQGDIKRGYIYSGSKRKLDSPNYGIYIGTDGISVADVFKVSADGRTIQIDAKAIILSKNTPITWGDDNSTDLQELVEGIVNGDGVPNYINHTFINGKKILSPLIYGGQFYATGIGSASGTVGNKNPAYYISDGVTGSGADMVPNQPIASLSYDTDSSDNDDINASTRVFLQVFNNNYQSHALKLLNNGGNISIESLCIDQGSSINPPVGNGSLYLKGQKKIHLTGPLVLEQLSTATSSIAEAYRGHYGTQLPNYGSTTYTPHLGRVFFKLK